MVRIMDDNIQNVQNYSVSTHFVWDCINGNSYFFSWVNSDGPFSS